MLAGSFALAILAIAMFSGRLPAQSSTQGPASTFQGLSESDPLVQDARVYAADQGVGLEEAVHRLELQDAVGKLEAELTEKERDTFAGLWIQHQPEFGVVVRLTRGGSEAVRPYVEGGPLANIVEVRSASATLVQLGAAQGRATSLTNGLDVRADSAIDVKDNRAELYVTDPAGLEEALSRANVRLPSEVHVVEQDGLSHPVSNIYAALELIVRNDSGQSAYCTSGFSVYDQYGNRGITTAAHCYDKAYRNGDPLTFISKRYGGSYDVQWHTAPGFTVKPWAADEYNNAGDTTPYYRVITATKAKTNQSIGDLVCKHGRTTGTTCGYIELKNHQPDYNDGLQWNATFIVVRPTSEDMTNGGDSGGPVYVGGNALGISTGETGPRCQPDTTGCTWLYYMAVDYVSGLGVQVLTR